jgi:hypothetical protein
VKSKGKTILEQEATGDTRAKKVRKRAGQSDTHQREKIARDKCKKTELDESDTSGRRENMKGDSERIAREGNESKCDERASRE